MFAESMPQQEEYNLINYHLKYNEYFRSSRNDLIDRRLNKLVLEQSLEGDYIDKIVSAELEASSRQICVV